MTITRINVKGKKVYYNYDNNGNLVEIIISDQDNIIDDVSSSWLSD